MIEVYKRINRVPRLYGIRWVHFLILIGILFVFMFVLIKMAGAIGIVLSFLFSALVYLVFVFFENTDRFLILGILNFHIKKELTSIGSSQQRIRFESDYRDE